MHSLRRETQKLPALPTVKRGARRIVAVVPTEDAALRMAELSFEVPKEGRGPCPNLFLTDGLLLAQAPDQHEGSCNGPARQALAHSLTVGRSESHDAGWVLAPGLGKGGKDRLSAIVGTLHEIHFGGVCESVPGGATGPDIAAPDSMRFKLDGCSRFHSVQ